MAETNDRDTEAYLARIRRTIAESSRLVEQAGLRMAETDRLLESQGLTREQVMGFRFTAAQREAVNEELRRRGMEPLAWDDGSLDVSRFGGWEAGSARSSLPASQPPSLQDSSDSELAERQRKFGLMMKPFQI